MDLSFTFTCTSSNHLSLRVFSFFAMALASSPLKYDTSQGLSFVASDLIIEQLKPPY